MIRAIAIDDELPALSVLENFCAKTDFIELQKSFHLPNEAMKYMRRFPIDLLFLDINMPSISGIELYKAIQQETMVIFTTAYSEHAVEGFNLNAVDYLLKPFTFKRFMQAAEKSRAYFNYQHQKEKADEQYLFIRADYSLVKISIACIRYIEGYDDYLKIHLQDQQPVITRMTLKGILEKLSPRDFIRVHRSYVVPLAKIESIRNKIISLGEIKLPLGNSYQKEVLNHFSK
jgi:DNA-binding LytR/AlgR family response regulator